jgi:lipid-A-disaccharide synthase
MIFAGEASGDLHGSYLVREIRKRCSGVELYGIGGDRMSQEGVHLLYHLRDLSVMGIWEVITQIRFFFRVLRNLKRAIREKSPELIILIDYPGLNIRLAKCAKHLDIPVLYYISPQVWAWGRRRIKSLIRYVDRMTVILDFEVELYRSAGFDVDFFGHPLVEELTFSGNRQAFLDEFGFHDTRRLLTLLPGSRRQEVSRILPIMASAAGIIHGKTGSIQVAVGRYGGIEDSVYRKALENVSVPVTLVADRTDRLIEHSDFLIVASGTATLEAAYYGIPHVIVYKVAPFTALMGRLLIRIPCIGLVNILAGRLIVREFIQGDAEPAKIAAAVLSYLNDRHLSEELAANLALVRKKMGTPGVSAKTAELALTMAGYR